MKNQTEYQLKYQDLKFEDQLRIYRMAYIVDYLKTVKSSRILEIGCGNDSIFTYSDNFSELDIIEPGNIFYNYTKAKIGDDPRITISNNLFEEVYLDYKKNYDIILIGGFLHEIDNPEEILDCIKKIAQPETIVVTFVPNANSFHRLLAVEAGLIQDNYEFSENDKIFGRRMVYNQATIAAMFASCGFLVIKNDTYFVKPFSHAQMDSLMSMSFFTQEILNGFSKIIKYMPDLGCEIFLAATFQI
jgi:SAM-dependent methyltransferase